MPNTDPTTARGNRIPWEHVPAPIRAAFEEWLGEPVAKAQTQTGGMSPGAAARIQTTSGRRLFIKTVGPEPNLRSPDFYRREALISPFLPTAIPAPRLLWSHDEGAGGWVALAFEDIDGRQPTLPWRSTELDRVIQCLIDLTDALTASPLPADLREHVESWGLTTSHRWARLAEKHADKLDQWTSQHIDALVALETKASAAVTGDTLLHLDLRDDNLLLTPDRVVVLDWTHARLGAPWLDIVLLAPSVAMQGGPDPDSLIHRHPAITSADPEAVTAAIAAIAGSLTYGGVQSPPPGLPSLPHFMEAQAAEARRWLRTRTGWI